ncbi:ABC-type transport auxiliary lipoprotein family protein [Beijerinckia indica]|uniref:Mammalian cell entry related domain protein n=1 Tax=Beijerinckia indica subsp. indica (strain ATCC 9039 / DSM 1715 / NCIMB 8712) TaxID=395963 RepID=B2IFF5_BEII9|nr:ABC-type transport auxiliary lipoprotein family protein [Beijerinckia indica]ACB97055.1 Mammalian cell entry related domain protein [Beijerinckia indica subsp. indica ATCC 9039]
METTARYLWVGLFSLAVIAAGFILYLWSHNSGGLAKHSYYQVRFAGPVSGLQTGSTVQFNGIRVGEVTALALDARDPSSLTATIAIAPGTPVRSDTKIDINFQGLLGTPAIALSGGTLTAPELHGSETQPPLLRADALTGQDLTQAARAALQHINKILDDNADSLKGTLGNLKTFTDVLARNTGDFDKIIAGLVKLAGGGPEAKPKPVYDLTVTQATPAPAPKGKKLGQIVIAEPTTTVVFDTQRLLARSKDGEFTPQGEMQWADSIPKLVQEKMVQSFENEGLIGSVTAPVEGVTRQYQLLTDIRNFAVTSDSRPSADVELSVKLMNEEGHVIAGKIFHVTVPVESEDTSKVVAAFSQAFNQAMTELISWTRQTIAG